MNKLYRLWLLTIFCI